MTITSTSTSTSTPDPLGAPEIAAYLSVSERAMRDLISRRQLTAIKIGQRIRVRRSELDAYLTADTREAVR